MNQYSIRVFWSDADQAYVATCPELDDITVVCSTRDQAVTDLEEMIDLALASFDEQGWERPQPQTASSYSGQLRLRLPRSLHQRASDRARMEGCSLNSLLLAYVAEGLGLAEQQAVRQG